MLYTERKETIMKELALSNVVSITELAKAFQVSTDTIRRDLKNMEHEGLLKCVRGGACLSEASLQFSNFSGREIINSDLKREAAQKAVSLIQPGDTIFINSGTTNTILAQEIISAQIECSVITNNIAAISVLNSCSRIHVIVLGGEFDPLERSTFGNQCEIELQTYYPDLCFLSINAVNDKTGFTDFRFHEIDIMKKMATQSGKVYAIMDSSKIDTISKKLVFSAQRPVSIVMDNRVSPQTVNRYIEAGFSFI